jgi:peptidoglycan-N-acetylmuramic acid deacetylase
MLIAAVTIFCADCSTMAEAKKKSYDQYSTAKHGWGLSLNTSHKVPVNGEAKGIKKKNAYYYVRTKKKRIYLSFDCGYENGHTARILNILKKHKIKAIFFVTKDYIKGNAKLVKRMKREGHLVGNHTINHPSLPTCSVSRIKKEILGCASYMKKKTGYEMDKFIRPPMGEWSHQSLKVTQDIGYTTIFWSMAFYDYDTANQPGKAAIYNQFMAHYHKGEIVLLHAISKSDTQALPSIIKAMKKKGYSFGMLSELKKS